jgi:5'-nucleotidase
MPSRVTVWAGREPGCPVERTFVQQQFSLVQDRCCFKETGECGSLTRRRSASSTGALWLLTVVWCGAPIDAAQLPASSGPSMASVSWAAGAAAPRNAVHLQILAFNDFHGYLLAPATPGTAPIGGAVALAAYLGAAERAAPGRTLIVHAGDLVGASPPATRLLHNEPGIEFLNLLANRYCRYGFATHFFVAGDGHAAPNRCNVVGTLGNHEFDAGIEEIQRLLNGGNASDGPFLENPYRGSRVPYVSANVIDRRTGKTLLPPYAVADLQGVPVGVIGAVLRETPSIVPAWAVKDVEFLDEAESINQAAATLEAKGIHTLVVIIHQGLTPIPIDGGYRWEGPLRALVAKLDPDIDVVVSGHTHDFTNALLPSRDGSPILVTQAYSYGVAFAQIQLQIDRATGDVIAKSARIVPTWSETLPKNLMRTRAQQLVDAAQSLVAARISRVVTTLPQAMTRAVSPAGESAVGDLVADAQRAVSHSDIALTNPGGLRSDLHAGPVTWGDILTLQPFSNHLVTLDMTGEQLLSLLEQQWPRDTHAPVRILKTSGLYYDWDATKPAGAHVVSTCDATHAPIEPARHYRVTVNDYLAAGGDGFALLPTLGAGTPGPLDADALEQYLHQQSGIAPSPSLSGSRLARADLGASSPCSNP